MIRVELDYVCVVSCDVLSLPDFISVVEVTHLRPRYILDRLIRTLNIYEYPGVRVDRLVTQWMRLSSIRGSTPFSSLRPSAYPSDNSALNNPEVLALNLCPTQSPVYTRLPNLVSTT